MPERRIHALSREYDQNTINIRFHHLEFFHYFAREYLKEFENRKPWEISQNENAKVERFTCDFLGKKMSEEAKAQTQAITNGIFGRADANYFEDVIGKTKSQQDLVTVGRCDYLISIFNAVRSNPDSFIKVNTEKDGICNSCIAGSHCKEQVPFFVKIFFDEDYIIASSLNKLLKLKTPNIYVDSVIKIKEEYLIKSRLLFNLDFYRDLRMHAL